jgi:hypothetical protein
MELPALPSRDLLTDLCKEVATLERVAPATVEKDFYLTRLIWALAENFGDRLLLKGGTLLSKVDLGYHRMSEDVDMVIPQVGPPRYKPFNARTMNGVRDALRALAPVVGLTFPHPDGERFEQHRHVIWSLPYASAFGPQGITVEVSLRPVHRPPRKAPLKQLLMDPLAGDYASAYCWALDATEARAEKVRAACTRTAARDFYDLGLLIQAKVDLSSEEFVALVNAKLAEVQHPALSAQREPFGLTPERRRAVEASLLKDLPAVLRLDERPFNLDEVLRRFQGIWGK